MTDRQMLELARAVLLLAEQLLDAQQPIMPLSGVANELVSMSLEVEKHLKGGA